MTERTYRLGRVYIGAAVMIAAAGAAACALWEGAAPATQPSVATRTAESEAIALEAIDRPDVPLRAFVAKIKLDDPRVRVRCVPAGDKKAKEVRWPTELQTVSHVAAREGFDLAVNGDFFGAEKARDAEGMAALREYVVGRRARPTGVSVTDGVVWSKALRPVTMLVFTKSGAASIRRGNDGPDDADQVISGSHVLVWAGRATEQATGETRHPRTAAGLSRDRKRLILVVVDGRSIRSRGATLGELAELCRAAGAFEAFNLDGGGSTTMVCSDELHQQWLGSSVTSAIKAGGGNEATTRGAVRVLNTPSDGSERPVANVLGVVVRSF